MPQFERDSFGDVRCDQCGMLFNTAEALRIHKTKFCIGIKDSGISRYYSPVMTRPRSRSYFQPHMPVPPPLLPPPPPPPQLHLTTMRASSPQPSSPPHIRRHNNLSSSSSSSPPFDRNPFNPINPNNPDFDAHNANGIDPRKNKSNWNTPTDDDLLDDAEPELRVTIKSPAPLPDITITKQKKQRSSSSLSSTSVVVQRPHASNSPTILHVATNRPIDRPPTNYYADIVGRSTTRFSPPPQPFILHPTPQPIPPPPPMMPDEDGARISVVSSPDGNEITIVAKSRPAKVKPTVAANTSIRKNAAIDKLNNYKNKKSIEQSLRDQHDTLLRDTLRDVKRSKLNRSDPLNNLIEQVNTLEISSFFSLKKQIHYNNNIREKKEQHKLTTKFLIFNFQLSSKNSINYTKRKKEQCLGICKVKKI